MCDERIILCEACGSEGRNLLGDGPHPTDYGPCPVCEGTGSEIIATEPVDEMDLDDLTAAESGSNRDR